MVLPFWAVRGAVPILHAVALDRVPRVCRPALASFMVKLCLPGSSALCPQCPQALESTRLGVSPVFSNGSVTTGESFALFEPPFLHL